MKKFKILIPCYNDWQSLFKLLNNIGKKKVYIFEKTPEHIGEDKASFSKLFKDDMKQVGKFKNPKTGKLEGGIFPNPKKGYQVKQFFTGRGGLTRTLNPFLGKGQGLRSGPTPLARQTPRLLKQGAKKLLKLALTRRL